MAKVIGFNEDVAQEQTDKKKARQRAATIRYNTRNIRFVKDSTPLTHRIPEATGRAMAMYVGKR